MKNMRKTYEKDLYIGSIVRIVLEIHIVNFQNLFFVFACLYSFLNIYY